MKKMIAMMMVAAIACMVFAGCGKKNDVSSSLAPGQENPTVAQGENAVLQLPEDFNLTDEQMKEAVSSYVDVLSKLCDEQTADSADGKHITALVLNVHDDNTVTFDATAVDAAGQETTTVAYSFNNMKEAFAYLFASGCVDAEGNVLVSGNVAVADEGQSDSVPESEAPDSVPEDADSASTSASSSEAGSDVADSVAK